MTNNSPNSADASTGAKTESFRASTLGASLTANDLQKSVAWQADLVGVTVDREYEHEGKVVAVSLKAGNVGIVLNQDDGAQGSNRVKGAGLSLQFTTAQYVDEIAKRIKANGGTLESEPADMPWGARIFRLRDPDGFKLVISTER